MSGMGVALIMFGILVLYLLPYALRNKGLLAFLTIMIASLQMGTLHMVPNLWAVAIPILVTGCLERRKDMKQFELDMKYAGTGFRGSSWAGFDTSVPDDSDLEDDFALAEMLVAPSPARKPLLDITIPDAPERRAPSAAEEHDAAVNDALFKRHHANQALHYNPNSYDAQRKDAIARQAEQKARRR